MSRHGGAVRILSYELLGFKLLQRLRDGWIPDEAVNAGRNLPVKEFCYLRTVNLTAAVWTIHYSMRLSKDERNSGTCLPPGSLEG